MIFKAIKNLFARKKNNQIVSPKAKLIRPKGLENAGNKIILIHNDGREEFIQEYRNLQIKFIGKNAILKIHESVIIRQKLVCYLGENAFVLLSKKVNLGNVKFSMYGENSTISIGENTTIHNASLYCDNEPNLEIFIGDNTLLSIEIVIRACDGHTIYEKTNPKRILNKPTFGVHIGNHTWIGQRAFLLKDSHIPSESIVAANSVVTRQFFEPHILLCGIPATVLRHNVSWDRAKISQFETKVF